MGASFWLDLTAIVVAGLPGVIAAVYSVRIHRNVQTPSGDTIGHVTELTHDLSAADLAMTTQVRDTINGGNGQ